MKTLEDLCIGKVITLATQHKLQSICDYGCGDGSLITELSDTLPERQLCGIDYFGKKGIAKPSGNCWTAIDRDSPEFVNLLGSHTFDIIFSTFTLHHFQYPVRELQQIAGMVKRGGFILFYDHCFDTETQGGMVISLSSLIWEVLESLDNGYHRHHYTFAEAKDLLSVIACETIESAVLTLAQSEEKRTLHDENYLESVRATRTKVMEKHSRFQQSIYLPLLDLDINTVETYGSDYGKLIYFLLRVN